VVLIEGKQQAGGWVLSVSDNGIGIPAEQSHRIFEMFTRLNNKKDYAGSGLGLSICRRIAELHHGQITVTSIVDEGSRFELTLPAGLSQP
jgi:signal transduction histidine kinase